ncbi:MAG TPA: hypothetical protein QGG59_03985 [Planctomycetota bacterium]|jgi:hypothetical protein|nr:hypothetical protein [Planctomycetota bacterium]HJM39259.1 hypothetical protein [Planctomycetota bacterium]
MKRICFTLLTTLFCAGLNAQSSDAAKTGVQPEFGFVLDAIAINSDAEGTTADLRMAELSVSSRIDPLGRAFAILEFPSAEEVHIPEAVMVFDGLGDGWEIRAGRSLLDFGKWNTTHMHDLPTPNADPVRTALFGGALSGTGLEVHRWWAQGDTPIRFSFGAWPSVGAHSHSAHGHEEEHGHGGSGITSGVDGPMSLSDWSFSGRLASQMDFGANGWWQWGLSCFSSQQGLAGEWHNEDNVGTGVEEEGEAFGLGARTFGVDLSLRTNSLGDEGWNSFTLEYWRHLQDGAHAEGVGVTDYEIEEGEELQGAWLTAEHGFSKSWSGGAHAAWWEESHEEGEPLETALRYGIFINRHFSEFQRLRFSLEQLEEPDEEPSQVLSIQWSTFLGKHRHGLDW